MNQQLESISTAGLFTPSVIPDHSEEDPGVADDVWDEEEDILGLAGFLASLLQLCHVQQLEITAPAYHSVRQASTGRRT